MNGESRTHACTLWGVRWPAGERWLCSAWSPVCEGRERGRCKRAHAYDYDWLALLYGRNRRSAAATATAAAAAAAESLQLCLTLCDPIDGSPPGSPIPGILQARTLEWVAISFSSAWKWTVKVKSLSRVWLFVGSMDCSPPGSSVHGIFQARGLEWVAIAFTKKKQKSLKVFEKDKKSTRARHISRPNNIVDEDNDNESMRPSHTASCKSYIN